MLPDQDQEILSLIPSKYQYGTFLVFSIDLIFKISNYCIYLDCPPNCKLIYLPTCVVLVSDHPFYNFMKDALSG